jgi:N-acetylmuramoyl-L-alanine amidase-like
MPLLLAGGRAAAGRTAVIARLIREAPARGAISQRIDFISHALLGVRYQADTLIGGPREREQLVMRDDAFDCVTYCETVLAAALSKDLRGFATMLRRIRYAHDAVRWNERNHYFADWERRNVAKHICRPVAVGIPVRISKTVYGVLGSRQETFAGIPGSVLLAKSALLRRGDVIGFVSRQPHLDFFHVGLIAFARNGRLLLRHASQRHGRVLDEDMQGFLAANDVGYVTVLRAQESAASES